MIISTMPLKCGKWDGLRGEWGRAGWGSEVMVRGEEKLCSLRSGISPSAVSFDVKFHTRKVKLAQARLFTSPVEAVS